MRLRTILPIGAGVVGIPWAGAWLLAAGGNEIANGPGAAPQKETK